MKRAEKLIEIESLLENLMKKNHEGGILRMKVLMFCYIYENLSVSMIIEKLGIKKTNFALMTSSLECEGKIVIKQSCIDRRCHQIELTKSGKEELESYLKDIESQLGATSLETDQALDILLKFLNKIV